MEAPETTHSALNACIGTNHRTDKYMHGDEARVDDGKVDTGAEVGNPSSSSSDKSTDSSSSVSILPPSEAGTSLSTNGAHEQRRYGLFDASFVPICPGLQDSGLFAVLPSHRNDGNMIVIIMPLVESVAGIAHTSRRLRNSGPYIEVLRRGEDGRLRPEHADPPTEFVVLTPVDYPDSLVLMYQDDYSSDMEQLHP